MPDKPKCRKYNTDECERWVNCPDKKIHICSCEPIKGLKLEVTEKKTMPKTRLPKSIEGRCKYLDKMLRERFKGSEDYFKVEYHYCKDEYYVYAGIYGKGSRMLGFLTHTGSFLSCIDVITYNETIGA